MLLSTIFYNFYYLSNGPTGKVTSPIYRTRSYTRGQGNAKRAGTSRDGSSGIPVLVSVNPVPY